MSLMQESDPRFVHLERKVGLFIFLAFLATAVIIVMVGLQQDIFTPKAALYFLDDSGRDLGPGLAVVTRGFKIGKVSSVRLNDKGKVEVRLAVNKPYMKWVKADSTARLSKENLIGDSQIEISPGTLAAPTMKEGSPIPFVRDQELSEVAKTVMEEVKPVLLEIKRTIGYIGDPQGDFKQTMANVNKLTASLLGTRENIDRMAGEIGGKVSSLTDQVETITRAVRDDILPGVRNLVSRSDQTIADAGRTTKALESFVVSDLRGLVDSMEKDVLAKVEPLLGKTDQAVDGATRTIRTMENELPGLLEKMNAILKDVAVMTETLKSLSGEAPGIVRQSEELLRDTSELMKKTKSMWPFRDSRVPREEAPAVDTYRPAPAPAAGKEGQPPVKNDAASPPRP